MSALLNSALHTAISTVGLSIYSAESRTLPLIYRLVSGKSLPAPEPAPALSDVLFEINRLTTHDRALFADGILPIRLLSEELQSGHLKTLVQVLRDGVRVARRQTDRTHNDLPEESKDIDFPDYYTRNFHFQTDGYFSEKSAAIYDHQVQILFRGTAHMMRRIAIPEIYEHLKRKLAAHPKTPVKVLDMGAGTGSSTKPLSAINLNSGDHMKEITHFELSPAYSQYAKKMLKDCPSVYFERGLAESLPYKEETFDVVTSTYLFHEVPRSIRRDIISEAKRVLKPGGLFVLVDSLQAGDNPVFEGALKLFPVQYHEPFYKDYTLHNLSDELREVFGSRPTEKNFLLTKSFCVHKEA